ncbi:MAG TPA: DUF362 domain-containing protein [Candidatus Acidoferrum sp.]|nr:DUF362 domain-containing protein [Candidatus Acidoferrum sp.]
MSRVVIVRGTDPPDMAVRALEQIDAAQVVPMAKPVLIKPNYINASHPSTGVTTDARVIEGVVVFLKKHDAREIIIGEGAGDADTLDAFKVGGVDDVARRWNVRMVDLNKDEFREVSPPNARTLKKVKIARTALESTIISVPKLKPHRLAGATLSLKNMMGAVTPKGSMHGHLNQNIVDLASVIKPCIAVIDGIVAGEGHETSGDPVEMNLVIAGTDPVAVDTVGAAVMGISVENVRHLRLAEESGLGTCHLEQIQVLGEPIEKVTKKFRTSFLSRIAQI